jgi:hypothetical protein
MRRGSGNGRVKRSAAEWRKVFERCEASGVSALAFCAREGIPRSSFAQGIDESAHPKSPVNPNSAHRTLRPGPAFAFVLLL